MRTLLICLVGVGVLIAGCASFQTEIIQDPGKVDSLTVGRFTTRDPVDNELIGSYLRKELSNRDFQIVDNSPYVLSGTIDVNLFEDWIKEARIVLKKNSAEFVVWYYEIKVTVKTRKQFAEFMASKIQERLR